MVERVTYLITCVSDLGYRYGNDLDIFLWLLLVDFCVLDLMNNIHACDCAAKDGVFVVEPGLHKFKVSKLLSPLFLHNPARCTDGECLLLTAFSVVIKN
jgi:hypothetical protein